LRAYDLEKSQSCIQMLHYLSRQSVDRITRDCNVLEEGLNQCELPSVAALWLLNDYPLVARVSLVDVAHQRSLVISLVLDGIGVRLRLGYQVYFVPKLPKAGC